jgi:integrase/recombinase XerC
MKVMQEECCNSRDTDVVNVKYSESANESFRTQPSVREVDMSAIVESKFLLTQLDNRTSNRDFLAEFLRLQISDRTKQAYASAIDGFFNSLVGSPANAELISEFLQLGQGRAIELVLSYQADLREADLAPATINLRLAAIKSLVAHARKLGYCEFDLKQVKGVKARAYRDTTGVKPEIYAEAIGSIDRTTPKGKRDYAIARLLWDNALRRNEVQQLKIEDYKPPQLWIWGKGRTQQELIDLSKKSILAIEDWLSVRGSSNPADPLFIALDNRSYGKPISGRSIDRNVVKEFGIETKKMSPHKVRHSTITAALDSTDGNVRKVQKFSRHRTIDVLLIYDDNRLGMQGEVTDTVADLV